MSLTLSFQALCLKTTLFQIFSAFDSFKILKIIVLPHLVLFPLEIGMTTEDFSGISKFSWQFD